ncbi:extracellular solute-binding protein [Pseudonocardia nematodicida]|uniref:Extracellular solute-binding protein n=1 Tax=Pseudonocardia nematodicida TaxID=1206997 RepID=A0ABV1KIG6_9PSEU
MRIPTRALGAAACAAALAAVAACGAPEPDRRPNAITVWTQEDMPERLAVQRELAAEFTERTGIAVELVGVAEDQTNQLIISAAASGTLPDVIGAIPLALVHGLAANELIDTGANAAIIDALGPDTFAERALELTRDGDAQLAVPSDGYAQMLLYRTDLFAEAGLDEPRTFADVTAAARALHGDGIAGFVGSTTPGDAFTQQTFEHFALANGCELVDDAGEITLETPACVETLAFYADLVRDHSVSGAQDVDTTRATYFAGRAAMVVWSSFVLDELAGLRDDAAPSCPECVEDPRFLVDNTGVVTGMTGPDGSTPTQFGEIVSWSVIEDANAEQAGRFVEFMMSEGYTDWLGFAPEGKVPTRTGTADAPTAYADAWRELPAGVDTRAPLTDFYPPDVLDELVSSVDTLDRWGIPQGQGALVGATLGELPVPQAVGAMAGGELDPAEAAEQAAGDVAEIRDSLR